MTNLDPSDQGSTNADLLDEAADRIERASGRWPMTDLDPNDWTATLIKRLRDAAGLYTRGQGVGFLLADAANEVERLSGRCEACCGATRGLAYWLYRSSPFHSGDEGGWEPTPSPELLNRAKTNPTSVTDMEVAVLASALLSRNEER